MRHWSRFLLCLKSQTMREERLGLPAAADPGAVNAPHSVLSVSGVLHLHESKTWWSPSNPNVSNRPILGEGVLKVIPEWFHHVQLNLENSMLCRQFHCENVFVLPISIISKSSNVDLAVYIPVTVSHCCVFFLKVFGLCWGAELLAKQVCELE